MIRTIFSFAGFTGILPKQQANEVTLSHHIISELSCTSINVFKNSPTLEKSKLVTYVLPLDEDTSKLLSDKKQI